MKLVYYSYCRLPEWVDRIQPEEFIMQQIQNRGATYVHGLQLLQPDKFEPARGNIIVYNGSDCYLFTGLTGVGSDESPSDLSWWWSLVTKEPKMSRE